MWDKLFRNRHVEVRGMSALAISDHTHDMLRQMALPLVTERRVKGALHHVSRETGVSYSKLRKIYYRLTDHILAVEWSAIKSAHARWLDAQEKKLQHELDALREMRAQRHQGRLDLGNTQDGPRAVATGHNQTAATD